MSQARYSSSRDDLPSLTARLIARAAAWHSRYRVETRACLDERHLLGLDPRLLADVELTRAEVAHGALRPRRQR